ESLAMGKLQDGFRAFFIDMQQHAETAAKIIYDSLHAALNDSSNLLAKMAMGEHPKHGWGQEWGKAFQQLGEETTQSSIKSLEQRGLGALGKHLGIDIGGVKPDGTAANPLWVKIVGPGVLNGVTPGLPAEGYASLDPNAASAAATLPKLAATSLIFSAISKLFGGAAKAGVPQGGFASLDPNAANFSGFLAGGGDVTPGNMYMVGENGPEPFVPSTAGRVLPNGSLGGNTHLYFNTSIDARGSEIDESRLRSILAQSHRQAVAQAVEAMHQRQLRTPRR
ncbi:MAG TPA: hypothetical protein VMB85_16345, partial [Bryobacteraceae bacterium]|nr:hypothetical protein [Bryobacteraceae bacterium]